MATLDKNIFKKLRVNGIDTEGALIIAQHFADAQESFDAQIDPAAAVPDLAVDATLDDVIATVNDLLAKLRVSGALAE